MGVGRVSEEKNEDESGAGEMENEDGYGAVETQNEAEESVDHDETVVHWGQIVGEGSDYKLKW